MLHQGNFFTPYVNTNMWNDPIVKSILFTYSYWYYRPYPWVLTDIKWYTHGSLQTLQGIAIDACGRYKV